MEYGVLKVSVSSLFYVDNTDLLLLGCGGHVELIDVAKLKTLQRLPIFKDTSHTPHGFVQVSKNDLHIKFIVYGGKFIRCILLNVKVKTLLECDSGRHQFSDWILDVCFWKDDIYAVTAHNEVIQLESNEESTNKPKEIIHKVDEKCILYSAFIVSNVEELVILGGTVFRQVIVYSCTGSEAFKISHRLTGHEGVIFSVQYHNESSLICSTSDDRTARLWKVENPTFSTSWREREIHSTHVLSNGHTSRVFRCLFLSKNQVITGGEDSKLRLWNTQNGACLASWKAHDGSPIWSLAHSKNSSHVITGGGDGSVKRFSYDLTKSVRCIELNLESDDYAKLILLRNYPSKDILVLTWKGSLIQVPTTNELAETRIVLKDAELGNHAIMKQTSCYIYFATLTGKIKWFCNKSSKLHLQVAIDGKILAMEVIENSDANRVLICGLNGLMKLYEHKESSTLNYLYDFFLPPAKEQRLFSSCSLFQTYLLIGDRNGSLHIYSFKDGSLLHTIPKVHSRHGISFIEPLSDLEFYTGGRDGKLKTFAFDNNSDKNVPNMSICQNLKLSWLERLVNIGDGNHCILGFHSSSFVVHSIIDAVNLSEIVCGGGHRSWDFNGCDFAYIKDKQLMFCKELLTPDTSMTIKNGLHSLVINCVEHCQFGQSHYLFTGSEDTFIKVINVTEGCELKLEQTLRSHLSSVKAMHIIDYTQDKKILVTAGGRAQFKVWLLEWNEVQNIILVSEVASKMLKGNDKQRQKSWKEHDLIDDTETRYLSVQVKIVDKFALILTACSDGVLRVWKWEMDSNMIELISETAVMDNAILKVALHQEGFLAADTLGNITFWDLQDLTAKWKLHNVHENGVNAMTVDSIQMAFTGGDDGSVAISDLKERKIRQKNPQCNAAHITGIETIEIGDCRKNLISVSVDQRITRWKISTEDGSIHLLEQGFSSVPDIHDMVSWKTKSIKGDRIYLAVVERLRPHSQPMTNTIGKAVLNKSISDIIDVFGTGNTPPLRKRKAALQQGNVLKKLKGIKNHQ